MHNHKKIHPDTPSIGVCIKCGLLIENPEGAREIVNRLHEQLEAIPGWIRAIFIK